MTIFKRRSSLYGEICTFPGHNINFAMPTAIWRMLPRPERNSSCTRIYDFHAIGS